MHRAVHVVVGSDEDGYLHIVSGVDLWRLIDYFMSVF